LSQNNGSKKNAFWVLGAAGAFLLSKAKLLLALLKFGKFGATLISMLIWVGAYAFVAPLPFVIGVMVLIFIHELGHVWAAKRKKLPVTAPLFIPFMGALITLKRNPLDAHTEAYIAFGGPLLGTVGALGAWILADTLHSQLILSVAYVGFLLNLFNLLPIHPLDGGRIASAVSRWLWPIGLLAGTVLIFYYRSYLLLLIVAYAAYRLYQTYIRYRNGQKTLTATSVFDFPAEHLVREGFFIPGEQHRRELSFTTYSHLAGQLEGRQTVDMSWDAIGFDAKVHITGQCIVEKVFVTGVKRIDRPEGLLLQISCQIDYKPYENDKYYDVPIKLRWAYGAAYLGLAAFLFFMMHVIRVTINLS
jgi:Zn-dependent protease